MVLQTFPESFIKIKPTHKHRLSHKVLGGGKNICQSVLLHHKKQLSYSTNQCRIFLKQRDETLEILFFFLLFFQQDRRAGALTGRHNRDPLIPTHTKEYVSAALSLPRCNKTFTYLYDNKRVRSSLWQQGGDAGTMPSGGEKAGRTEM